MDYSKHHYLILQKLRLHKGIDKCNEPKDIEWSYNHIFYTIKDDDDIVEKPVFRT